jgi:hypothetical protein
LSLACGLTSPRPPPKNLVWQAFAEGNSSGSSRGIRPQSSQAALVGTLLLHKQKTKGGADGGPGSNSGGAASMPAMNALRQLIIVQMLLATHELTVWARTLVELLVHGDESDLVLRCVIQLLETHQLIDPKTTGVGKVVLACRKAEEWVPARLLASKPLGKDKHGHQLNCFFVQPLSDSEKTTVEQVLPSLTPDLT